MRDPRETYKRIAPEILLFKSAEEARAAMREFRPWYMSKARFWIAVSLLLLLVVLGIAVFDLVAVPFLGRHGVPAWMNGFGAGLIGSGVFGIWGQFEMRRPMRRYLRETLVAAGVPVCLACGYNLRGLTEPRCPECGAPFDPALLDAAGRTPSVSDGP